MKPLRSINKYIIKVCKIILKLLTENDLNNKLDYDRIIKRCLRTC